MPEQPPDPRNYDMRIPPPSDPNKKEDSPTLPDRSDSESDTARNSRDEKPSGSQGRNQNP